MGKPNRVQFKFEQDTQVGVSYYGANTTASFGEEIAKKLEKEKRGKIVGGAAPKTPQADDRQVTADPANGTKVENRMVDAASKPSEGTRTKLTK